MKADHRAPPPSIAHLQIDGIDGLLLSCAGCGREVHIAWEALRLPEDTPFPEIARVKRYACTGCGSRDVALAPDHRGYAAPRRLRA